MSNSSRLDTYILAAASTEPQTAGVIGQRARELAGKYVDGLNVSGAGARGLLIKVPGKPTKWRLPTAEEAQTA